MAENDLNVGTVALTSGTAGEGVLARRSSLSAPPEGPPRRTPEERQPSEATSGPAGTKCKLTPNSIHTSEARFRVGWQNGKQALSRGGAM